MGEYSKMKEFSMQVLLCLLLNFLFSNCSSLNEGKSMASSAHSIRETYHVFFKKSHVASKHLLNTLNFCEMKCFCSKNRI